ncbi:hypothetical protein JCM30760_05980 [Thiomicrorhabdus hydrogeniphila]
MIIAANEIKTKGVSLFGKVLDKADELIINVRGKNKYVVLDIERYNEFRQNELELAHFKVMQDIQEGRYKKQTSADHVKELMDAL